MKTSIPGSKTLNITIVGIFAAISTVVYMLFPEIPLGFAHLKIDFSDASALIVGMLIHPVLGILIEVIKNIIHLFKTDTFGIGEVMNVLIASVIIPVIYYAKKFMMKKTKLKFDGAYFAAAVICLPIAVLAGYVFNLIFVPLFMHLSGIPFDRSVYLGMVCGSATLNLLKVAVMVITGYPVIKVLKKALRLDKLPDKR